MVNLLEESNLKVKFRSYSKAAAEKVIVCQADRLANLAKEEDRSKSFVKFGPPEQKDAYTQERVQEEFLEIGLKPTLHATRVGTIHK